MDPSIQPMGKVFVCDVQEELPLTNKIATNQTSHFIFLFWKLVHFSNFPAISYHFQQYFSDIVAVRFIGVGNDQPVASH